MGRTTGMTQMGTSKKTKPWEDPDWDPIFDEEDDDHDYDEDDGDALASAGFGTDEDYGGDMI